jgi:T5SS/PEP-CTERM-associated repeat protein
VGSGGDGTLTITSGGTLNSTSATSTFIGSGSGSSGTVTLSGNGSTWTAKQPIFVGNQGTGSLTVGSGATLSTTAGLVVTAGLGTMTMNGGIVDANGFTRSGTFNFNDGTLIVRGAYSNGTAAAPLVIDGNTASALPTLQLIGNSSNTNITTLTVGSSRQGALVLSDGRSLSVGANTISIGSLSGSSGSITLSGAGTQLTTTGSAAVGGNGNNPGGTGVLTIGSGSGLSTGSLIDWPGGTIILNGGALNVSAISASGGTFDFNAGTINFAGGFGTLSGSHLDLILGAGHFVSFGRVLSSSTALSLGAPVTVHEFCPCSVACTPI